MSTVRLRKASEYPDAAQKLFELSKTWFNHDFVEEQLLKAGFREVHRCAYMRTASRYPEIVSLDNRESESLYVEAVK